MLNYKCKSHRGRSSENKTDALCMVEVNNKITYARTMIIPNKKSSTILPLICDNVISGSIIHTDEHKSYKKLSSKGFIHGTVTHKYEFINKTTGVHTQAVESFHNCLKMAIKNRKGIITDDRVLFLQEFTWKFNNRTNRFQRIIDLIKIQY